MSSVDKNQTVAQAAPAAGAVAGPVKQCAGIPRPGCDYMAECGSVCRKCGKVHSAHLLMFDTPQPRWASYEVAVSDPVFQVARSIMGTENMGQDRQLVAAINHVLAAAPTPAAQADSQPSLTPETASAMVEGMDMNDRVLAAIDAETRADSVLEDAAFEAVRKKLCALPRYSFVLDDDGLVRRVLDRSGNWIEFDEAHALFDPISVDAARKQGGTHDNH